jgi:hypothetical protein
MMGEHALPEHGSPATGPAEEDRASWLDLLPLVWLAVVLAAYGFVTAARLDVPYRELLQEIPEVTQLGLLGVPVLALTLLAGIIRYFRLRRAPRTGPAPVGTGNGGGDSS